VSLREAARPRDALYTKAFVETTKIFVIPVEFSELREAARATASTTPTSTAVAPGAEARRQCRTTGMIVANSINRT
jgi:hypothetical protein